MSRNMVIENHGVNAVGAVVTGELRWLYRPQPTSDVGIDAQIEVHDGSTASGRLLGAQIKTGYAGSRTSSHYRIAVEPRHVEYWDHYSLPVLMIVHDPATAISYWTHIAEGTIDRSNPLRPKVLVPLDQVLDVGSGDQLAALARPASSDTTRAVALDQHLLEHVQRGDEVRVDLAHAHNKAAGWVTATVTSVNPRGDVTQHERFTDLTGPLDVPAYVRARWPWARTALRTDVYEKHDRELHALECGVWDSENEVYHFAEEFDEWHEHRFARGELRAYGEGGGGELSLWALRLTPTPEAEAAYHDVVAPLTQTLLGRHSGRYDDRGHLADGYYEGDYFDNSPYGPSGCSVAYADPERGGHDHFWSSVDDFSDPDTATDAARAILDHLRDIDTTSGALAAAFTHRFAEQFAAVGQGFLIDASDINQWLRQVYEE